MVRRTAFAKATAIKKSVTPVATPVVITVRGREGLTERPRTLEGRPIAIAHMSPGETKNEDSGFLLFGGRLPRRSSE